MLQHCGMLRNPAASCPLVDLHPRSTIIPENANASVRRQILLLVKSFRSEHRSIQQKSNAVIAVLVAEVRGDGNRYLRQNQ